MAGFEQLGWLDRAAGAGSIELRKYLSEAQFFFDVVSDDLKCLPQGARILEVGSGVGLLSILLAQRGFNVTAVEPQSAGFSQMREMRSYIQTWAGGSWPSVEWIDDSLSVIQEKESSFDYVIAINVVEHVSPIDAFIEQCVMMAKPGCTFRFVCPNYAFPYEPHFNIPTLFSKRMTEIAFAGRIKNSTRTDALKMWNELSWPTVANVKQVLTRLNLPFRLNGLLTKSYINRVRSDRTFTDRKGPSVTNLGRLLSAVPDQFFMHAPKGWLPVLDCSVTRPAHWERQPLDLAIP